jgi:hypothetical protein
MNTRTTDMCRIDVDGPVAVIAEGVATARATVARQAESLKSLQTFRWSARRPAITPRSSSRRCPQPMRRA